MKNITIKRNFPVGCEVSGNGAHFRVWAPDKSSVDIVLYDKESRELLNDNTYSLEKEKGGYFSGTINGADAGTLYKFMLNGVRDYYPDPASRFQPLGPHGPSEIIDADEFKWTDKNWEGIDPDCLVLYEMHFGTFTHDGTYRAAEEKLEYLAETGINCIELMPVAEFPGKFGWGYDGVILFAVSRLYGRPDDLKSFINTAHNYGIGVILDVVYNHLGPDGNYLSKFSESYFSKKYKTDWGEAINYDGENSEGVREFFKANAAFWISEYHMDGLRLDATQDIFDSSKLHILSEINDIARETAGKKPIFIVTENEPQHSYMVTSREEGGNGFNAIWNDDFHHSATAALTGKNEAYYTDYMGKPQEFVSALKYGFLYQGQHYKWQKKRRGSPALHIDRHKFVNFIQNHDQIANSGRGFRINKLSSPGNYRAVTALLLLAPQTPMLFQGQEFGSSTPFLYFADHNPELSEKVTNGRYEFLRQFRSLASKEMKRFLNDPGSIDTFIKSKLDFSEVERHAEIYKLHKDLIALRKNYPVFRKSIIDGAVIGSESFVIRYFYDQGDVLLIVNLGLDLEYKPAPEPLLAPPAGITWKVLWSSEHPSYGGNGTPEIETKDGFMIPGNAAVVLIGNDLEELNG